MRNNLLPVAKEGISYIAIAIASFAVLSILDLDFLQFFSFLTIFFLLFVFRNPEREVVNFSDHSVATPVDGVVTSIEELKESDFAYKIVIQSSYFNVALLRSPFTAELSDITIHRGSRLSSVNSLSHSLNEFCELTFSDKNNNNIKVVHQLKQSFMSIEIDAIKSQKFLQGARYGVMINGTTTLYLPQNFRLNINVGAELNASETLVGYFT